MTKNAITNNKDKWQFWIDRGGTFTDIIAKSPTGEIDSLKLLSNSPNQYSDAAIEGIQRFLGNNPGKKLTTSDIEAVKMGTTVATNALLERKGEPVALVTTAGFGDVLRIGYQKRPDLFALNIKLPEMLYSRVIEIEERILADGTVAKPINHKISEKLLQEAYDDGIRSVAIVFIHGYRYTQHEKEVASIANKIGFAQISVSHVIGPLIKIVSRGDTTVLDAYLTPILNKHIDGMVKELANTHLMFMQSNGGLAKAGFFQGKDSILSGPAGGVVGAIRTSAAAGFDKIIGFDMGGTSTDVSHYNGIFERTTETEIAGVRIRSPMMAIHTVAAGGGSILHFDGSRYRVGPDSAGADPGPACYKKDGPLTITDANIMVGKLQPFFFPPIFGKKATEQVDKDIVKKKFQTLAEEINEKTGDERLPEEVASGYLSIAVENMANAIKKISIKRGYDITKYTLCSFGGAAGQHSCLVADALGLKRIFVHPFSGVLSAFGIGLANITVIKEETLEKILEQTTEEELNTIFSRLSNEGIAEVQKQGASNNKIEIFKCVYLRYQGSDSALVVNYDTYSKMKKNFNTEHQKRYGFFSKEKNLVIESLSVETVGLSNITTPNVNRIKKERNNQDDSDIRSIFAYMDNKWHKTPIVERDMLDTESYIKGPSIITEQNSTIVVEPGWQAVVTERNELILERVSPLVQRKIIGTEVDPVMLEIFNNLFMAIAEQMGSTLQNTASSINIKERLDFSCAIFDSGGNLIANAPHLPVHLGSMSESIQTIIRDHANNIKYGDVYMLNSPYNGGTHLPDITVIKPVFDQNKNRLLFFTGSRGHHADIGGITPGSMPPNSTTIQEEGVLIDNFQLVERGYFCEQKTVELFASKPYPSRNIEQNIADLKAQIAACEKGAQELLNTVEHFGLEVVQAYMNHVQDNAEECVRKVISKLSNGSFEYPLDDGSLIHVDVKIDHQLRSATVDFTGTSSSHPGNFNAPRSVATAAVLYVFRTLVPDVIPLNSGCLKPIKLIIPKKSMLNPTFPSAVVAGNVETSQNITEALFGALRVIGSSQGTMNNFTFGNEKYQYYETIAGGTGAGKGFDGAAAVQAHMTNTRITDPEILELRFPVILESHSIRRGSGGLGKWRGGDGALRRVRFCESMTASILSSHRVIPPFGMLGGEMGECGKNWVERADGSCETTNSGCWIVQMHPGDVFVIQTPTGGGYGRQLVT